MNPYAWLVGKTGAVAAKWITLGVVIGVVWLVFIVVITFNDWRSRSATEAQAEQTTASSEAISQAAGEAVDTVVANGQNEVNIDAAVAVAQGNIDNAANSDDVRDAVLAHMCMHNSPHRDDPACAVYRANP